MADSTQVKKKRVYKKKSPIEPSNSISLPISDTIIPIILESPNKIKKILSFLPSGKFVVLASCGHFRTFSNSYNNMGFTIDGNNIIYQYINDEKKKTIITNLKSKCKDSPVIFLATDPDREGEAIAWHIAELLGKKKKYYRIKFNSITKNEVIKALDNPTELDMNLVNAQITRMMIDKWIGFKVSPLCWSSISKLAKSAGRVQSPALKILVDREREIINFQAKEYFTIQATFSFTNKNGIKLEKKDEKQIIFDKESNTYNLLDFNLKTYREIKKPIHFESEKLAMSAIDDIENSCKAWKFEMKQNETNSNPPPPYTTLSILQDCHTYLKINPDHAMNALQKMYESGWITYHRTDSVVLSPEGLFETRDALKLLHPELISEKPRNYTNKNLNAQEAHEPIRPTHYEIVDLERHVKNNFGEHNDCSNIDTRIFKIYSMVYFRTLASQCKSITHITYNIEFSDSNNKLVVEFSKTYSYLKDLGWKQLYWDKDINKFYSKKLDNLEKVPEWIQAHLNISTIEVKQYELENHHTIPPPFFTSSTLIKELENLGIGRPSTYAFILSKLFDNQYIFEKDSKLHPTPIALQLIDFLQKHYDKHFMNLKYTQNMEKDLDEIAQGKSSWTSSVIKFIKEFPINIS